MPQDSNGSRFFSERENVRKVSEPAHYRQDRRARCLEFARDNGIRTISLEVRQSNLGAQEFYRTLHFAALYIRPRYYPDGEAAVVMVRELSA